MKSRNNRTPGTTKAARFRRLCIAIHRDFGYFFAGVILIYAISGIAMNHRNTFNVYYDSETTESAIPEYFPKSYDQVGKTEILRLLDGAGVPERGYSKHFKTQSGLKVLIKGGSSIMVDFSADKVVYEKVEERVILGNMARLHYNPGSWWTVFSDIFAGALILITITGMIVLKGKLGFFGRGGIMFIIGVAVPVIFLLT